VTSNGSSNNSWIDLLRNRHCSVPDRRRSLTKGAWTVSCGDANHRASHRSRDDRHWVSQRLTRNPPANRCRAKRRQPGRPAIDRPVTPPADGCRVRLSPDQRNGHPQASRQASRALIRRAVASPQRVPPPAPSSHGGEVAGALPSLCWSRASQAPSGRKRPAACAALPPPRRVWAWGAPSAPSADFF